MIFKSFNFIVLFPFIFLLYYAIPAGHGRARNLFLLAVSYLLYMQWKPAYALVLLGVTVVTWLAALLLEKTRHPKRVLAAGVVLKTCFGSLSWEAGTLIQIGVCFAGFFGGALLGTPEREMVNKEGLFAMVSQSNPVNPVNPVKAKLCDSASLRENKDD